MERRRCVPGGRAERFAGFWSQSSLLPGRGSREEGEPVEGLGSPWLSTSDKIDYVNLRQTRQITSRPWAQAPLPAAPTGADRPGARLADPQGSGPRRRTNANTFIPVSPPHARTNAYIQFADDGGPEGPGPEHTTNPHPDRSSSSWVRGKKRGAWVAVCGKLRGGNTTFFDRHCPRWPTGASGAFNRD